jgi:hypothetical protein
VRSPCAYANAMRIIGGEESEDRYGDSIYLDTM